MQNRVRLSLAVRDEFERSEIIRLFERLPADILIEGGALPDVLVDSINTAHNYSVLVPTKYSVKTHDKNCVFLRADNEMLVGINCRGEEVHGRDYIDFGDISHPQKVSHRFWINPRLT